MPAMRRLVLDRSGIPTGEEEHFGGINARLGELDLDDGFALLNERPSFSIAGAAANHRGIADGLRLRADFRA